MRARRVALRQRWISSVRTSAGLWAHVSLTLWEPRAPFRFPSSHCTLETPRTVRCDGPSRGRRTYAWVTHGISHRLVTSHSGSRGLEFCHQRLAPLYFKKRNTSLRDLTAALFPERGGREAMLMEHTPAARCAFHLLLAEASLSPVFTWSR